MTDHALALPEIWRSLAMLILASAIIMGSPGPSTISLTAVGAVFGFRRSLLYCTGLVLGTTGVLIAVAAGIVAAVMAIPHGAPVLLALSTLYILYLAYCIATAPPLAAQRDDAAAPGFAGGLLLAIANPKAYVAIAAVFAGNTVAADPGLDAAVKTAALAAMILIIHLFWLSAGASLSRVLQHPTSSRIINLLLAASLVLATALPLLR